MSSVETILRPVGLARFRREFLFREPLAIPSSANDFRRLIGWDLLFEIFGMGHRDCWLANKGRIPEGGGSLTFERALRGFAEGHTVVVRRSDLAHPRLRGIADDFREQFGRPVDIQLYCTPAGEQGFGWHYDSEDVFVIQSAGSKEFHLRRNVEARPAPFSGGSVEEVRRRMTGPEIRCLLEAGDVLYIPAGFWHCAVAVNPSFHLSVGVLFD